MHRRRLLVLVIAYASVVACLFPSVSELTSDDASTDARSDAPTSDAPSKDAAKDVGVKDASSDVADANGFADATNLLLNPSFDQGSGACGNFWGSNNAFTTLSTIAHSGPSSCQVCQANTPGSYYVHPQMNVPIEAGVSYYFQAYVMAAPPDAGLVAQEVKISFRPFDDAGNLPDGALGSSPSIAAPTSWQQISFTHTANPGTVSAQVFFVSNDDASTSSCFLVDDVAMFAQ